MSLGDVQQQIRDALGRGNALDAQITQYLRWAARWIERNGNYKYMEKFSVITFNPLAAFPHVLDMPDARFKAVKLFRILTSDGRYHNLRKIDARDVIALNTNRPEGYWLAGMSKIILDAKPDQAYSAEICWFDYTPWPTATGATNWLLDNADDVLVMETLVLMAPFLRDPRLIETYKNQRDEALHTLESAQLDTEEMNTNDVMGYGVGSVS